MMNPKPILILMLLWISILVLLQGCAAPGFLISSSATTATASSSYQTYKTVTLMKAGVDTALAVEGKKTTTDHIMSSITGKDCKATRIIEEESLTLYCVDTMPDFLTKKEKKEK